jgi:hypothetical protein
MLVIHSQILSFLTPAGCGDHLEHLLTLFFSFPACLSVVQDMTHPIFITQVVELCQAIKHLMMLWFDLPNLSQSHPHCAQHLLKSPYLLTVFSIVIPSCP